MKKKKIIIFAAIALLGILFAVWFFWPKDTISYSFLYTSNEEIQNTVKNYSPTYPDTRFMVISDLHLHDPALGISGKAFETYLEEDRKLIRESREILDTAVKQVIESDADFLLIPGDLTKDGEKHNHLLMSKYLKGIAEAGKKVFIVPGNHDINNGLAHEYKGDEFVKTETIQANDFTSIYKNSGYGNAIERDPDSLSYVAEPVPGLLLLALDGCRYRENKPDEESIVDGRLSQETVTWIEKVLLKAVQEKKAVIAMIHHGVVAHFKSQEKHFGAYLIDAAPSVAEMLAFYKVRMVFTGHFHAQDIAKYQSKTGDYIYDIETGSLVTYPSPLRTVLFQNNVMYINSSYIAEIPSQPHDFPDFSKKYLIEGLTSISIDTMKNFWVPEEDAIRLAPQITDAFVVHYTGSDAPPGVSLNAEELLNDKNLSFMGGIVVGQKKDLVIDLWHDVPPQDNALVVDLKTGEIR